MKDPNNLLKEKNTYQNKRAKLIRLEPNDIVHAELEYEKYYNRIKMLSRGI